MNNKGLGLVSPFPSNLHSEATRRSPARIDPGNPAPAGGAYPNRRPGGASYALLAAAIATPFQWDSTTAHTWATTPVQCAATETTLP